MSGATPLPTFLIIGAQKSATRWLRLNLGLHPDIYTAPIEIEFFNNSERFQTLGVEWYRSQFEGWAGEEFVGEATPGYMFWRHRPEALAERIQQVVPDVRLVAILRDPVDRAQSAVIHHIGFKTLSPDADVVDVVRRTAPEDDPLGIVSGGWYGACLEPFQRRFGDQLLVLLHDDTEDDPRGFYDRALRHIGATADFAPPELDRIRFSNQEGPGGPDGRTRHELNLEQRRDLYQHFTADIEKLEELFDLDLSRWDPERAS
ncbi:MAG: sulfotransferase domain-containing protein [Acidimicrobiia bacterium]